jgi:hypothetical protein
LLEETPGIWSMIRTKEKAPRKGLLFADRTGLERH